MIVGLNTARQVEAVADMMDGIAPRPELVEPVLAFWRKEFGEAA